MKNGAFITVEGVHGSGKTTCIRHLEGLLATAGYAVTATNDQCGSQLGRGIRELHLNREATPDLWTEAFLVAAASRQNLVEVITPALRRGEVVLSERFGDAFIAFQGYGRGLDMEMLRTIRATVEAGLRPDLTLLLDVDPLVALKRPHPEPLHRIEREPDGFHERVRQGHLVVASQTPDRTKVIDAHKPLKEVVDMCWQHVYSRILGGTDRAGL